jgi:uncharacterized membrane protein
MTRGRLEAFSDGVMAVLITIMVLELKPPHGEDLHTLLALGPAVCTYLLSFVFLGIYWNNHHHMFHTVDRVDGRILWANLHLLFWLSLVPVTTAWMGDSHLAPVPTAAYGAVLLASGVAYLILQTTIVAAQGPKSRLAALIGADLKGKASAILYAFGIAAAFVRPSVSAAIYAAVALMWLVPDRRIEKHL